MNEMIDLAVNLSLNPKFGQVWTPYMISLEMVSMSVKAFGNRPFKRILDPACGPATFSKALHESQIKCDALNCYDIDERMTSLTTKVNSIAGFKGNTLNKDYLADSSLEATHDFVIMNPPYIRQELIPINDKQNYHQYINRKLDCELDKRSNLFVLFMLKGIIDLKPNGIMCAIVYDAISHSQYGKKALAILNQHAETLDSKKVQTPFNGVLIDAQILVFRKRANPINSTTQISTVQSKPGTISLGQLIETKRGTSLQYRKAFLANENDPFFSKATPFFYKQSCINELRVKPNSKAYLFSSESEINPKLEAWLKSKIAEIGIEKKLELTHSTKTGPLLFNYYIRKSPRHLWNPEMVTVSDNFYVSVPKHGFPPIAAWLLLNSDAFINPLLSSGRNQGSGLTKLQVFEYKQALVPDWTILSENEVQELVSVATHAIENHLGYSEIINLANKTVERLNLWR